MRPTDEVARLLSNERVADGLYVMRLAAPDIASGIEPGQFVHLKIPGFDTHILRRPFSVWRTDTHAGTIDILYQVVGRGSARMTQLDDSLPIDIIGPVGTGWKAPTEAEHVLLVAGGVGAAPLFLFCESLVATGIDVHVILGARNRDALVCRDAYAELLGEDPVYATDDGSLGFAGFCTVPAKEYMEAGSCDFVACCGPEPVMRIVSGDAAARGIACQVSLERRMACGIGACLSCVVDTVDGKRRACVDGPVFDAGKVVW